MHALLNKSYLPRELSLEFLRPKSILCTNGNHAPCEFVMHVWRSIKSGDRIGICYPVYADNPVMHPSNYKETIESLLQCVPECTYVALITDDSYPENGYEFDSSQREVLLRSNSSRDDDPFGGDDGGVRTIGTRELSEIMGIEIPYWPSFLRDPDAMLSWRPGDYPQSVQPTSPCYSRDVLPKLAEYAEEASKSSLHRFYGTVNKHIEKSFEGSLISSLDEAKLLKGCSIAAYPQVDIHTELEPISPFQFKKCVLDVRVPDERVLASVTRLLDGHLKHSSFMRPCLATIFRAKKGDGEL